MMKSLVIVFGLSFIVSSMGIIIDTALAGHQASGCSLGYGSYGCWYKHWCSNARPAWGSCTYCLTCTTASCQDGNSLTTNTCQGTYCSSSSCPANTADVNNNPADGCEVNLLTNPSNCGSVGNVCASGVCNSGVCNDFSISIDPTKGIANRGDVKIVNATATKTVGSPVVTFSATGVPAGTTVVFSPASCTTSCYSNATVTTTGTTPIGSSLVSIRAAAGSLTKSSTYNLTVLPSTGLPSCGNLVCNYPETQSSCASDCLTTTTMPSPVTPGEIVSISVEFYDFRYLAGEKVRIDLKIDGTVPWTSSNGCMIGGVKMGPSTGGGAVAWPSGTVSEDGHFKVTALCTVPSSISSGAHTLSATPTIF